MADPIVPALEESILKTIKPMLGVSVSDTSFDMDIIVLINSSLAVLNQNGIGVTDYEIIGDTEVWADLLGETTLKLTPIKTFVFLYVKLIFDPPTNSSILEALKQQKEETLWRLEIMRKEEVVE